MLPAFAIDKRSDYNLTTGDVNPIDRVLTPKTCYWTDTSYNVSFIPKREL